MNTSFLKAISKLYNELTSENVLADIASDTLTENKCNNGREVIWFMNNEANIAIYVDTLEILSTEEIERELAD